MGAIRYRRVDNDVMVPDERDLERFRAQFEPGKIYWLIEQHERSNESHGLYFAALKLGFENLPDDKRGMCPTVDDWRSFALIATDFYNTIVQVFDSPADAIAGSIMAAMLARRTEDFVITEVEGSILTVYVAKSQKTLRTDPINGMDKKDFEASKQAVLEYTCTFIGMDVDTLMAEAKARMHRR